MIWPPPAPSVAVIAVALAAVICDLKTRRIPNVLTLGGGLVAFALHSAMGGWSGLLLAVAGWAVGLALFFPLFLLRGMGAGDVKLLAAIGALLGPWGALWTALYGAVAGGLMALAVSLARGYTMTAFRNLRYLLWSWFLGGVRPVEGVTLDSSVSPRLPYAVPIAAGVMATLWTL